MSQRCNESSNSAERPQVKACSRKLRNEELHNSCFKWVTRLAHLVDIKKKSQNLVMQLEGNITMNVLSCM